MTSPSAGQAIDTQAITDKARRNLLQLLEAVSAHTLLPRQHMSTGLMSSHNVQVRGKKNLVLERSLAGTVGLFVKFSTLQDYGVDKLFFLENHNVDHSQQNIVFLALGENAKTIRTVAGMFFSITSPYSWLCCVQTGSQVEYLDFLLLFVFSLDPKINVNISEHTQWLDLNLIMSRAIVTCLQRTVS